MTLRAIHAGYRLLPKPSLCVTVVQSEKLSNLCLSADPGPNAKKKRVSWAEDENLCVIHYFQLDESERGKEFKEDLTKLVSRNIGTLQALDLAFKERCNYSGFLVWWRG